MSQTTSTTRSFGYFLNGGWSTHGREAVVTSPYDHSVLAVISEAGRDDVETAIESAVQAFAVTRKMTSHQRAGVLTQNCRRHYSAPRRVRPHHLSGGRQADQDGAHRGGPRHQHLSDRRRRKPRASTASTFRSTRWNPPPADGGWCDDFRWDRYSASRRSTFR